MDAKEAKTWMVKAATKGGRNLPDIKRVAIPDVAHPILSRLPGVEEVVCYYNPEKRSAAKSTLTSLRSPSAKEKKGQIEPVLKSLTFVGSFWEDGFVNGTYTYVPSPYFRF